LVDEGFDAQYGARPLRRAVQRLVEDVVAECVLDGFALPGETLTLDTDADGGAASYGLMGGGMVRASNSRGEQRNVRTASVQGIERSRAKPTQQAQQQEQQQLAQPQLRVIEQKTATRTTASP